MSKLTARCIVNEMLKSDRLVPNYIGSKKDLRVYVNEVHQGLSYALMRLKSANEYLSRNSSNKSINKSLSSAYKQIFSLRGRVTKAILDINSFNSGVR